MPGAKEEGEGGQEKEGEEEKVGGTEGNGAGLEGGAAGGRLLSSILLQIVLH